MQRRADHARRFPDSSAAREDLAGATVATVVSGLLGGGRVVLVRRDGGRVPLHAAFIPFTRSSHESAAFRLSELL